jgi:hypothetical protein
MIASRTVSYQRILDGLFEGVKQQIGLASQIESAWQITASECMRRLNEKRMRVFQGTAVAAGKTLAIPLGKTLPNFLGYCLVLLPQFSLPR